ncbi:MAG: TolC family protein [Flavobacteriaceae bacterium]|jgi:outer membrane protein TolC|nr:TolC family protein [Flavobacteriaceae bacterium]
MKGNIKKCLVNGFSLVLFFGLLTEVQAQELTFSEAYAIMNKENTLIKAVEKQEEIHEFKLKAMKGLRYPSLKAVGVGIYMDRSLGLDFNGLRNGMVDFFGISNPELLGDWSTKFNKRDMAMGGFMATWPLYTGGKINAAIRAHELEREMGEKDLSNTKNKLVSELAQRYYQVKLADEAVIVRQKVYDGMLKHLHDATKLEENGMIAPVEKLSADVAVSEANRQLVGAKKDASLARVALANTMEVPEVKEVLISDFFTATNLESLKHYQDLAVNNYPMLQKLALQKELAEEGVKVKKSSNYPTVLAFGQTLLVHNNPMPGLDILNNNKKPWTVGVGVSYTLFEGFKNRNEIKAAKATKESVELYEHKAQGDIKMLVEKIYKDIEKQEEQIKNLSVQETLATEFLRVRTKAFSEGFATSTEVTDAEMNLSGVKLMKLQASYEYAIGVASLLEYTGLSSEFLQYTK